METPGDEAMFVFERGRGRRDERDDEDDDCDDQGDDDGLLFFFEEKKKRKSREPSFISLSFLFQNVACCASSSREEKDHGRGFYAAGTGGKEAQARTRWQRDQAIRRMHAPVAVFRWPPLPPPSLSHLQASASPLRALQGDRQRAPDTNELVIKTRDAHLEGTRRR